MLIAVCVLSPAHLEHVLGFTSFRLCFGGVLRGRFVPRTCFDRVPAGTVLAETRLFRTHSDYKKWCVPRTCSENMFPLELYQEQVWTPGNMLMLHPESGSVYPDFPLDQVFSSRNVGHYAQVVVAMHQRTTNQCNRITNWHRNLLKSSWSWEYIQPIKFLVLVFVLFLLGGGGILAVGGRKKNYTNSCISMWRF